MEDRQLSSERVCDALGWDAADRSILLEPLVTLPHSFVARVQKKGEPSQIFKQAGSSGFAAGVRKEIAVNRDVLSRFRARVAPALVAADERSELPWLLFEDVAATHAPAPSQPPPEDCIRRFVAALAATHSQARGLPLESLFERVEGDVRVTDGSEAVPGVLDAFLHATGGRFSIPMRELVEALRDHVPAVASFLGDDETLIHGDAHFGNAMYDAGGALLIDWALAVIGPGEVDLTHALAMNLPRALSRECERDWLRLYAEASDAHGHRTTEAEVRERYRRCLLLTVIVAVGMHSVPGLPDPIRSFLFENAAQAALDHDVRGLIS